MPSEMHQDLLTLHRLLVFLGMSFSPLFQWAPTDLLINKDGVNAYYVLGSTLGVEDTTMKKTQYFAQELIV